jgi:hypothetical protein
MADKTAIQETAAALFCAIADNVGHTEALKILNLKTYPTYTDFKQKHGAKIQSTFAAAINSPGVSLKMIEDLLESNTTADREFYDSSVNIANKLISDIQTIDPDFSKIKPVNLKDIIYYRADNTGNNIMTKIGKLFSYANKREKFFGDINKWSPADIYLASVKADKEIEKQLKIAEKAYNFSQLNDCINDLIDKGELIGISLKKSVKSASLYRINFTKDENQKILNGLHFASMKSDNPRDVIIYFKTAGSKPYLKARHDPSSDTLGVNKAMKLEVEIVGARGGSLVGWGTGNPSGTGFTDIWARVDPEAASKSAGFFSNGLIVYTTEIGKLNKKYTEHLKLFNNKMTGSVTKTLLNSITLKGIPEKKSGKTTAEFTLVNKIFKTIITNNRGFDYKAGSFTSFDALPKTATLYDLYKNERITLSQVHIINPVKKHLIEYFKVGDKKCDNVVKAWYIYVSAMSPASGKFVIAKT